MLLGMLPNGALFAHGRRLFRLPFDAQGQFGEAAEEVPSQAKLPSLQSPGALDQSARARAQAMNAGAAGYLAKPFDDDELLNCIHSVLENAGADVPQSAPR